jgi:hypothetical protein
MKEVGLLKASFTPKHCCWVTWAILDNGRSYFDDVKTMLDFQAPDQIVFPQSYIIDISRNIRYATLVEQANFLDEWKRRAQPTQETTGRKAPGGTISQQHTSGNLKSPEGYTGGLRSPGRLGQGGTKGSFGVAHQGQHGGITPRFSPGGNPGQQHWRAGWFDQRHPKFKAMMDTYLDLMQGCLQLADVLNASGKWQTDLPTLPKYTHPYGRPFLCWLCILSRCRYGECRFLREGGHPDPANITDDFANSAVDVLSKGIIARVNQLQSGGSPQIKKQKSDAGTPA